MRVCVDLNLEHYTELAICRRTYSRAGQGAVDPVLVHTYACNLRLVEWDWVMIVLCTMPNGRRALMGRADRGFTIRGTQEKQRC